MKIRLRSHDDIRRYRAKLGLSQEALARLADVSVVSIGRWERGAVEPSRLVLRGLQGFLDDVQKERRKTNG